MKSLKTMMDISTKRTRNKFERLKPMKAELGFSGSFPRDDNVAKLYSMRKSKEIDEERFAEEIISKEIKLLEELEKLGFAYSTDGMLWADDIINPIVSSSNVEINGLVRFFDNNFFVRSPVVKEDLAFRSGEGTKWLSKFLSRAQGKTSLKIKAPLPGPITLAAFSQNRYYSSLAQLTVEWGEKFLVPLIEALKKDGFSYFELHEPSIMDKKLRNDVKDEGSRELASIIERFSNQNFLILTYFNGSMKDVSFLLRVAKNNSIVGVDLHTPVSWRVISGLSRGGAKAIYLGALDSRNPVAEKSIMIKRWLRKAEHMGFEKIVIGNNAPMDFIPPKWALSKLRKLSRVLRSWGENA